MNSNARIQLEKTVTRNSKSLNKIDRRDYWFPYGIKTNSRSRVQLFCFPFAGGNAASFKPLIDASEKIAVIPVELPGRGQHLDARCVEEINTLVDTLIPIILDVIHGPFALFGHSLGAIIAFQIVYKLQTQKLPVPINLIVAGRHAPHKPDPCRLSSRMNDREMIAELRRLNGTQKELLDHSEMLGFLLPMIRSDLKLHESFKYAGQSIDIPITAHCGSDDDEADMAMMDYWEEMTSAAFTLKAFSGDHFFVQALGQSYIYELMETLLKPPPSKCFA